MCGIAGIFRPDGAPIDAARLLAMRDDQTHRGPDASGLYVGKHIGLAFNRLAVIDLSTDANQPMSSDEGDVRLVFNGEIYNFQELRKDLLARGRRFRTRSDTEVILRGYQEWGLEVFPRLNGMFAIGLWDESRKELHLVRDRVGKKPLHYVDAGGEVVFASELRALLKGLGRSPDVDPEAIDLYLTYLSVPGERTIDKQARKVPPATVLTCSARGIRSHRYWRISFGGQRRIPKREALEHLDDLLADATRIRMISDVPVGAFLSGGVDSSLVVALMTRVTSPVRTFSARFPEIAFDESAHARRVAEALGTRHQELVIEPDAAAILPLLVWHYGEPFADSSSVPTYCVSAAARRHVTVALNGDGGDEGFAGYFAHRSIRAAEIYRRTFPALVRKMVASRARGVAVHPRAPALLQSAARLLGYWGGQSATEAFWVWAGCWPAERELLYSGAFKRQLAGFDPRAYGKAAYVNSDGPDDLSRALQVGIETYLADDLLVKMDIASMANSLETRSPFLDYRVLEFAATLPTTLKLKHLRTKSLLKTLAARHVPSPVVYRRKQGFAIPVDTWLRGPLHPALRALLQDSRFKKREIFEPSVVRAWMDGHEAGDSKGTLLWAILWLELWFRMFVDGDLSRGDSLRYLA